MVGLKEATVSYTKIQLYAIMMDVKPCRGKDQNTAVFTNVSVLRMDAKPTLSQITLVTAKSIPIVANNLAAMLLVTAVAFVEATFTRTMDLGCANSLPWFLFPELQTRTLRKPKSIVLY